MHSDLMCTTRMELAAYLGEMPNTLQHGMAPGAVARLCWLGGQGLARSHAHCDAAIATNGQINCAIALELSVYKGAILAPNGPGLQLANQIGMSALMSRHHHDAGG